MTDEAEKEIARLRTIIDCYAASSAAAAAELKRLRADAKTNTPTTVPAADWPTSGAAVGTEAMTTDEKDVLTSVLLSEIGTAQKYNSLVFDLQAEIARLRLTDAEREAVKRAAGFVEELAHPETSLTAAALRELLERLK